MKLLRNYLFLLLMCVISIASKANTPKLAKPTDMVGVTIPSQITQESVNKKEVINNLFAWINAVSSNHTKLNQKEMALYFDSAVSYKVNNKILASGIDSLFIRFKKLLANNEVLQVIVPLDQVIIADSQAAITYRLHISNKKDGTYTDHITALITFVNGKIKAWDAVAAHTEASVIDH